MNNDSVQEDPVQAAAESFGIKYVYPWQRLVIANVMDAVAAGERAGASAGAENQDEGENALTELFDEDGVHRGRQIVLLPTGAGKSLCFQLPALLLSGPTLVIYPLLALQGDQARRLGERGVEPAVFRGGQSKEEREAQFARLEGRDGKPAARLIIANPEVLAGERVLARIEARGISHLAIDEAHCVAEWGDTFRPAYLSLKNIVARLDPPAVTAFTATASPLVLARIAEILFGGRAHVIRGETDRPNIRFSVNRCFCKEPALLREVMRKQRPMIVFCATRGGTERTARALSDAFRDIECRFYHAGLNREEKNAVEQWFHGTRDGILTATCAWGMGIDMPNVRTVIHKDPPPTVESYIQEAGRAGRDGESAEAVLLWSPLDRKRIELSRDSRASYRARRLLECAEGGRCRRETLLAALGDPRAGPDAPGGERIACSGCDVCDGSATDGTADLEVVRTFVERNPKSRTESETAEFLHERGNLISVQTFGFPSWRRSDMSAMIGWLMRTGKIRTAEKWPWKGMLEAVPEPKPTPRRLPQAVRLLYPRRAAARRASGDSCRRGAFGNGRSS